MAFVVALPDEDRFSTWVTIATIWGSAIGLAAAHFFAFELSAQLIASGRQRRVEWVLGASQLVAAFAVAVVASIPVLVLNSESSHEVAEGLLALIIGGTSFATARRSGVGIGRVVFFTAAMLLVAGLIILFKATVGH